VLVVGLRLQLIGLFLKVAFSLQFLSLGIIPIPMTLTGVMNDESGILMTYPTKVRIRATIFEYYVMSIVCSEVIQVYYMLAPTMYLLPRALDTVYARQGSSKE
jgi:hypothetical protein